MKLNVILRLALSFLALFFHTVHAYDDTDDLWTVNVEYNETGFENMTDYEPSEYVQAFHACPHIGSKAQIISDPKFKNVPDEEILRKRHATINPQDKAEADAYWTSLLAFPILLGLIGILALVFLDLGIDGKFDWLFTRPLGPMNTTEDDDGESLGATEIALRIHENEKNKNTWLTLFIVAVFLTILGTNFVFIGNAKFDAGYEQFKKEIGEIADDLFTIGTGVDSLNNDLDTCSDLVNTAVASTCPQASDVPPKIEILKSQLSAFMSEVNTIGDYVVDVNDSILKKVKQKDAFIYTLYALSMALCLVFSVISFFTNQLYMKYTVYVAQFAIVILLGEGVFYFMLMMYFSDFCMDPMTSVYESMGGLGIIQQTAKHYGSCRGLNPIHRNLALSYAVRDDVGNTLVSLFDYATNPDCECRSDRTVIDSFRALQNMHYIYENLAELMYCPSVHLEWMKIYDIALCKNTVTGLMALWINSWFQVFGLFGVAISASVLMLYFDDVWNEVSSGQALVDKKRSQHEQSAKLLRNEDVSGTGSDDDVSDTASDASDANVRV